MKDLVLKINSQEEADFCSQILNKLGIPLFCESNYNEGERQYLYLDREFDEYAFTYDHRIKEGDKDNYILVNSWREFVINYLSNYYYKCESKQEKEQIINVVCSNNLNKRENFLQPISVDYCYCEVWYYNNIVFQLGRPENKQKISLDNLTLLINSVRQFEELSHPKNNKTMKKLDSNKKYYVKINDKYELAAAKSYLETFFKDNDIDIKFCEFMFRQEKITYSLLNLDGRSIINGMLLGSEKQCVSIQEFANWVKEKLNTNKTFTFSNGTVAKHNGHTIVIGCKEHSIEFFERFANDLIIFNMPVTFDGKTYIKDDFEKFSCWLNKIKE